MTRHLAALTLLALLLTGLLATCSGCGARRDASRGPRTAEDSLTDWRARADSLDGVLGSMDKVEGQLVKSVGTPVYAAWLDSGEVRVVHEELDLGTRGSLSNRYYFERGVPRLAVESGRAPIDTTPTLRRLERAILFDDSGRLVAATMSLDSVKTWVASPEAATALDNARRLRASAQAVRSSRDAGAASGGGTPAPR